MKAPHHNLTLAEFGRCPKLSNRNEAYWVSKLPNNLPSYTTKGKLCECYATEKFEILLLILTTATQCITIELQRPFKNMKGTDRIMFF